jgi:hypothetical protein
MKSKLRRRYGRSAMPIVAGTRVEVRRHRPGGDDSLLARRVVTKVSPRFITLDDGSVYNSRTLYLRGSKRERGIGMFYQQRIVAVA